MKVTLTGFRRNHGEYKERPFDNVYLYVVKELDDSRPDTFGKEPLLAKDGKPPKMKTALLCSRLGVGVPELTNTLSDFVGYDVDIFFDMFGNIEEIYFDK